ncbi:hypothetical protein A464_2594 [Salmonella bongori N268-08]|uniref:Uncharacterized protein n=1 Tax=Salmonella bongori N268-08 TaxID=1197719 RepID=S5MYU1_SALBN|nr:hypothetical protein A464_2594 [Salmonella bongori N268-08]
MPGWQYQARKRRLSLSRLFYPYGIVVPSRRLFTKHNFDKIFPVPQFTFNHINLSYYYEYSTLLAV